MVEHVVVGKIDILGIVFLLAMASERDALAIMGEYALGQTSA